MAQTNRHTDIHTDGHGDSMTDPAQRAESVKSVEFKGKFAQNCANGGQNNFLQIF